jgi:hypothetical protein
MTRRYACSAIALTATAFGQKSDRPTVRLQSTRASANFDLLGGSLISFQFHERATDVNPLSWDSNGTANPTLPRPRGHFLCMDRWGQPSEAEKKNGMPFHGEASSVVWKLLSADGGSGSSSQGSCHLEATLPLAQLRIERAAKLTGASLTVRERITNLGKLGRIYNAVQHPTIAPPFLDDATLVDANCGAGFAQSAPDSRLEQGFAPFRTLHADHDPNVASFVIDGPAGWVTALSPTHRLAIGYVWQTRDYPWLNIWRHAQNGKPAARGLEFGTTGLHQPFPEMVRRGGRMLDRPLFAYIDAGETQERSYTAFLVRTPAGAKGVQSVSLTDGQAEPFVSFIS